VTKALGRGIWMLAKKLVPAGSMRQGFVGGAGKKSEKP
jgi:hypothetical protein